MTLATLARRAVWVVCDAWFNWCLHWILFSTTYPGFAGIDCLWVHKCWTILCDGIYLDPAGKWDQWAGCPAHWFSVHEALVFVLQTASFFLEHEQASVCAGVHFLNQFSHKLFAPCQLSWNLNLVDMKIVRKNSRQPIFDRNYHSRMIGRIVVRSFWQQSHKQLCLHAFYFIISGINQWSK